MSSPSLDSLEVLWVASPGHIACPIQRNTGVRQRHHSQKRCFVPNANRRAAPRRFGAYCAGETAATKLTTAWTPGRCETRLTRPSSYRSHNRLAIHRKGTWSMNHSVQWQAAELTMTPGYWNGSTSIFSCLRRSFPPMRLDSTKGTSLIERQSARVA